VPYLKVLETEGAPEVGVLDFVGPCFHESELTSVERFLRPSGPK